MNDCNMGLPLPMDFPAGIPNRVQAAQNYLHFANTVRCNQRSMISSDLPAELLPLSACEQATYDAALTVLRLYFLGEMDYGDSSPMPTRKEPPDEPDKPATVLI